MNKLSLVIFLPFFIHAHEDLPTLPTVSEQPTEQAPEQPTPPTVEEVQEALQEKNHKVAKKLEIACKKCNLTMMIRALALQADCKIDTDSLSIAEATQQLPNEISFTLEPELENKVADCLIRKCENQEESAAVLAKFLELKLINPDLKNDKNEPLIYQAAENALKDGKLLILSTLLTKANANVHVKDYTTLEYYEDLLQRHEAEIKSGQGTGFPPIMARRLKKIIAILEAHTHKTGTYSTSADSNKFYIPNTAQKLWDAL